MFGMKNIWQCSINSPIILKNNYKNTFLKNNHEKEMKIRKYR